MWHDNGTYQEMPPGTAARLPLPLVSDDLPPRPSPRRGHVSDDAVLPQLRSGVQHSPSTPVPEVDPVVVVCAGCGNALPTTEHTPKLLTSPPCPLCMDPAPLDFKVLGELRLGHEDDAPESGVYLITDDE
jgi:hypothetical protein